MRGIILCFLGAVISVGATKSAEASCGDVGDSIAVRERPVFGKAGGLGPSLGAFDVSPSFSFITADPRVRDFVELRPYYRVARTRQGCWIEMVYDTGKPLRVSVAVDPIEVAVPANLKPQYPAEVPAIPGFEFIMAGLPNAMDYRWIGLWVANNGDARSKLIGFGRKGDVDKCIVLAEVPLRLALLQVTPPMHWIAGINVVSESKPGEPITWLWLGLEAGSKVAEAGVGGC